MKPMRKRKADFKKRNRTSPYYDLIDDYELIEASFAQQYGIRLRRETDMSWDEFCTLLSGISGDTPLGNVVQIRSEKDMKKIRNFTPEQKQIRNAWRRKAMRTTTATKEDYQNAMKQFEAMFLSLANTKKGET